MWPKLGDQAIMGRMWGPRDPGEMPRQWTEFRDEQNPEDHLETRWGVQISLLPKSNGKQEAVKRPEAEGGRGSVRSKKQ